MPSTEKWRVAVHEAGHAIAALYVGDKLTFLSIKPGAGFDGSAHRETYKGQTQYSMAERYIICSVAGYVAERLFLGQNDPSICVSDLREAWAAAVGPLVIHSPTDNAIAEQLYKSDAWIDDKRWPKRGEAEKTFDTMERECQRILEDRRAELERLAKHLEEHEACKGDDAEAICNGTWKA